MHEIRKTIYHWVEIVKNPPAEYKEYFEVEKQILKDTLSKDDIFLDVGCGTGRAIEMSIPFAKKLIGIDNDQEAVDLAKNNLKAFDNVKLFCENASQTNFSDKIFDVVFIGLTFCNFGRFKHQILKEIHRIMKDDGKLIISVFNEDALEYRVKTYGDYGGDYVIIDNRGTVVLQKTGAVSEQFSPAQVIQILDEANFYPILFTRTKICHVISLNKKYIY